MKEKNELGIKLKKDVKVDVNKKESQKRNEEVMQQQIQEFYLGMQQIQQQLEILAQQKTQFEMMKSAIKNIEDMDDNEKETIVSLAPGMFIKTKLKKPKKIIVNVGQNIMVEKTFDEALELVNEQIGILNNNEKELKKQFDSLFRGLY